MVLVWERAVRMAAPLVAVLVPNVRHNCKIVYYQRPHWQHLHRPPLCSGKVTGTSVRSYRSPT